jgi:hypothetical protein
MQDSVFKDCVILQKILYNDYFIINFEWMYKSMSL